MHKTSRKWILVSVVLLVIILIGLTLLKKSNQSNSQGVSPAASSSTATTIAGAIKIGSIAINQTDAIELQDAVNQGHQPWRLDSKMVLAADLPGYGFLTDDLNSPIQVAPPQNGTVKYQISHLGADNIARFYLIILTQPASTTIWMISDIEPNTLPIAFQSLTANLFGDASQQIVTAYELPDSNGYETQNENYEIQISSVATSGVKNIIYKEDGLADAEGGYGLNLQLIKSSIGKEGILVLESPAAADGGREGWHVLTAVNGKIIRLDRSSFLKQPLLQNGYDSVATTSEAYYIIPYGMVATSSDEVIETIPTDPFPNGGQNVVLKFQFKFTGDTLELTSVKKIPSS